MAAASRHAPAPEAVKAKYVWFEMLSLRDLLRWGASSGANEMKQRLSLVLRRMVSSPEELSGVLGEGVLSAL